jgi:hypothetical protein
MMGSFYNKFTVFYTNGNKNLQNAKHFAHTLLPKPNGIVQRVFEILTTYDSIAKPISYFSYSSQLPVFDHILKTLEKVEQGGEAAVQELQTTFYQKLSNFSGQVSVGKIGKFVGKLALVALSVYFRSPLGLSIARDIGRL